MRVFIDSFSDGWFTVRSRSGKQTVIFEDSNQFGPSFVNTRTSDVRPIPDKHWFWSFYKPWRDAGRPTSGDPLSTPNGDLGRATWVD